MKNNKPKHTPDPWNHSADLDEAGKITGYIIYDNDEKLGYRYRDIARLSKPLDESRANARLIAAAPEMLEALCSIYCFAGLDELLKTKYSETTVQLIMKQMRDAIAKAKGE